jgi:hypothetical protein
MEIISYKDEYKQQIIDLVLHIQNDEAKISLPIEEQPDLLDVPTYYEKNGGRFWVAVNGKDVIGTFAFMNYGNGNAVLKKFLFALTGEVKKLVLHCFRLSLDI